MAETPGIRVRKVNDGDVRRDGEFVLYWMVAQRRLEWNFALDRAIALARELERPLLVFEPLRAGYRWASDRFDRFVLDGMAEHAERLEGGPIGYFPFVESERGAGSGLLEALAGRSCAVVTDDFPAFFLPRMLEAAGRKLDVRLEAVDSNGLLPLAASDRDFPTAYAFRRHLQKSLPGHLDDMPLERPLAGGHLEAFEGLPKAITGRWRPASPKLLRGNAEELSKLPIDHGVAPVDYRGGRSAARGVLQGFLEQRLAIYDEKRNQPEEQATSGLSPYLHFGHISSHEVFVRVAEHEGWTPAKITGKPEGKRSGWWGMGAAAEAFLDELVTWREVGFNTCRHLSNHDEFESLPDWARKTLGEHEGDARKHVYDLDAFAAAETHDSLWNAAQTQLVREGRIHNYLRMLWGKKVLEWTASPRDALDVLIELNNKYAVDGRDPNSYSGIFWVLGRYDRPWGPEREIFGKIRYMTSENTARKVSVKGYIEKYSS